VARRPRFMSILVGYGDGTRVELFNVGYHCPLELCLACSRSIDVDCRLGILCPVGGFLFLAIYPGYKQCRSLIQVVLNNCKAALRKFDLVSGIYLVIEHVNQRRQRRRSAA